MTSYREREKTAHTISFREGKKVLDEFKPLGKRDKQHGMITKMIPSKKFLGPNTHLPCDVIEDWLAKISYFFSNNMKLDFEVREGLKVVKHVVFEKRDPVGLLYDICTQNIILKPITIEKTEEFDEEVVNTDRTKNVDTVVKHRNATYGIMFAYDDDIEPVYDSYCNFTNTVSGGVHMDSAEKAFCTYVQKAVKDSMTENEKSKLDILWNDIRTGLKMVVHLNTNANVQFEGNVKEKIKAEILRPILYTGFTEELTKYFNANPDKLRAVIKIVKTNAKARVEATKARIATSKETMTPLKEQQIPNYDRCLNTGKNDYREIFIVEGDSAKGSASRRRDPNFQAFFAVRGMTANPYKTPLVQLMDPNTGNKEWRNFVNVLRCGIGKSFDINKLYFDKIILLTDADIDGSGISSNMANFFISCLPGVVEAGKLYKALPPLYKINDGKNSVFIHNKEEYVALYRNKVIKNYDAIILALGDKKIDKETFNEFLLDTVDYLSSVTSIASHFKTNAMLVERIASFLVYKFKHVDKDFDIASALKNQKILTEFMSAIQAKFPEIKYYDDTNILSGIADGHHTSLKLGPRFMNKIMDLVPIYEKYGYNLMIKEKNGDYEPMSIGQFSAKYRKYIPDINERYKGLGEMSPKDLYDTTLDPNSRVLIQLTIGDLKKDIKVFDKLHGTSKKDKLARKKMMSEYRISPDDLDN